MIRAVIVQVGKTSRPCDRGELLALIGGRARVLVDVGTGDGRFVYRWAGAHPDTFCVGVDAAADRMREVSHRASRKPARGGRPNALYVVAAAPTLPRELDGLADTVSVNFPWGSLLAALARPDPAALAALRRLMKPGGELIALLNQSVFDDDAYAARLGLPPLTDARVDEVLRPAWLAAGLEIRASRVLEGDLPHQTSWGQHLTLASGRRTRLIEATAAPPAP